MFTYSARPVSHDVSYSITRWLPNPGQIFVKVGEVVRPERIVADSWQSSGFRSFSLSKILDVPPDKRETFLLKSVGTQVYKGEIIARRKTRLGLKTMEFSSPMDGIVRAYDSRTGILTLKYLPKLLRITSSVSGKVVEVIPGQKVVILSRVDKVEGRLGLGRLREGVIKIVCNRDVPLPASSINASLEGDIVVGGSLLTTEVVYRCLAVKVRGIVCGGINFEDFKRIGTSLGSFEDIGVTVLITEGFGNLPILEKTYQVLKEDENRYSLISGTKKNLIMPLGGEIEAEAPLARKKFAKLKVNLTCRLLTAPYLGHVGKVEKIFSQPRQLPSGITCLTCLVRLSEGETIETAVENVEIIEE